MRRDGLRCLAGWCLVLSLVRFGDAAVAADGPRDDRMASIVAAVRAEEAKFRDIEYTVRIVVRDTSPNGAGRSDDVTTMATRHVVFQGERTYLRLQAYGRAPDTKFRREEVSAFDGERTLTVVAGNSANIHLGRWLHPDLYLAHALPLAHDELAVPLSAFLGGTAAIHAHPAYIRELGQFGTIDGYVAAAARFESEEEVDGLRCLKVRVDRCDSLGARPLHDLWLAPGRNYHCIKDRLFWPDARFGERPSHEMRVEAMRELAPGVWFPTRIAVDEYDAQAPGPDRTSAIGRTFMTVQKVELAPRREVAFFRNVTIPAGLPVFTVKDRQLTGWSPPRPIDGERGLANLRALAARIAGQERRYDGLEIRAHERKLDIDTDSMDQNRVADCSSVGRSVQRGDRSFSTVKGVLTLRSGDRRELVRTLAHDGQWTRLIEVNTAPDGPPGRLELRKGRSPIDRAFRESDCPYQPHTLVLRDYPFMPTLDEMIDPAGGAPNGPWRCRLRDAGTRDVHGHPCLALAGDLPRNRDGSHAGTLVLYLAADRNDLPIKMEVSNGLIAGRPRPYILVVADDLREIAPGLWYPFRITGLGFETGPRMARGWYVLNWRRDTTIDSATLSPRIDESLFRDVTMPAGAKVQVLDEDGRQVGEIRQAEAGVPSITMAEYLKLLSHQPAIP